MKTNYIKAILMFTMMIIKLTPTIINLSKEIWKEVTNACNKEYIKQLDKEIKRHLEGRNE